MIKFKHKRHMHENKDNGKVVIYYNITDIFLGATLMLLVIFFIHDYLSHALKQTPEYVDSGSMKNPYMNRPNTPEMLQP